MAPTSHKKILNEFTTKETTFILTIKRKEEKKRCQTFPDNQRA